MSYEEKFSASNFPSAEETLCPPMALLYAEVSRITTKEAKKICALKSSGVEGAVTLSLKLSTSVGCGVLRF